MIFYRHGNTLVHYVNECPYDINDYRRVDLSVDELQENEYRFVIYKDRKVNAWCLGDEYVSIYTAPVNHEHGNLSIKKTNFSLDRILNQKYSLVDGIGAHSLIEMGIDDMLDDWMLNYPLHVYRETDKIMITSSCEEDAMEIRLKL